jgi:uncharacterized protein with PIN domain
LRNLQLKTKNATLHHRSNSYTIHRLSRWNKLAVFRGVPHPRHDIEADQSLCPACGADGLEIFPVLHHMICAYVGPQYDFAASATGFTCPKCRRDVTSGDPACEIVGTSARCVRCGKEMVVSPPPPPTSQASQN